MTHIGIASGSFFVGFVGTPIKYECSVFGAPVALAARCSAQKPLNHVSASASIVFPEKEWGNNELNDVFPVRAESQPLWWKLIDKRIVEMKYMGNYEIREIVKNVHHVPGQSAADRTKESFTIFGQQGRYWPQD